MARHKGLSFYKRRKKISIGIVKEVLVWFFLLALSVFLALTLVFFFGMTTDVVGVAMESELSNGQRVLINRLSYSLFNPKAGDVVVFLPNGNENSHLYVKRVVAVQGDTLCIADGILYVNDVPSDIISDRIEDAGIAINPIKLANDEYFVIGDNINNCEDSRSPNIGQIRAEDIVGKAYFKLKNGNSKPGFIK